MRPVQGSSGISLGGAWLCESYATDMPIRTRGRKWNLRLLIWTERQLTCTSKRGNGNAKKGGESGEVGARAGLVGHTDVGALAFRMTRRTTIDGRSTRRGLQWRPVTGEREKTGRSRGRALVVDFLFEYQTTPRRRTKRRAADGN